MSTSLGFLRMEKSYAERRILAIPLLSLEPGRIVHLSGRNGSGKTTLLKILAGLESPDCGEVAIDGLCHPWPRMHRRLQREVVYLHQRPYMFDTSVEANLGYGLRVSGMPRAQRRERVRQALAGMNLEHLAGRNARGLSGGEQQRLALARAWVMKPRLLLLDEPTASMDSQSREQTWKLLEEILTDDMTIIVSSHENDCTTKHHWLNLHLEDGDLVGSDNRLQLIAGTDCAPPAHERVQL